MEPRTYLSKPERAARQHRHRQQNKTVTTTTLRRKQNKTITKAALQRSRRGESLTKTFEDKCLNVWWCRRWLLVVSRLVEINKNN